MWPRGWPWACTARAWRGRSEFGRGRTAAGPDRAASVGLSGAFGSVEWWGGVLFAAVLVLGALGPALALAGLVEPVASPGWLSWVGLLAVVVGLAGVLALPHLSSAAGSAVRPRPGGVRGRRTRTGSPSRASPRVTCLASTASKLRRPASATLPRRRHPRGYPHPHLADLPSRCWLPSTASRAAGQRIPSRLPHALADLPPAGGPQPGPRPPSGCDVLGSLPAGRTSSTAGGQPGGAPLTTLLGGLPSDLPRSFPTIPRRAAHTGRPSAVRDVGALGEHLTRAQTTSKSQAEASGLVRDFQGERYHFSAALTAPSSSTRILTPTAPWPEPLPRLCLTVRNCRPRTGRRGGDHTSPLCPVERSRRPPGRRISARPGGG